MQHEIIISLQFLTCQELSTVIHTDSMSQQEISVLIHTVKCFKAIHQEYSRSNNEIHTVFLFPASSYINEINIL